MRFSEDITNSAIGLVLVNVLGAVRLRNLLVEFGSPEKIIAADREILEQSLGDKLTEKIIHCVENPQIPKIIDKLKELGADILIYGLDGYPERLKDIYAPPPVLFVLGEIKKSDERAIAMVGTRRPSHNGVKMAQDIADGLARSGITIISGLALGIDGISHRAALKAGGRTIAVLGSGLDIIYPADHRKLAEKIIENGAVISEFIPGTRPEAYNFPRRNRIISGLALGVVIVEAGKKSGALITATHALEQGREVFAVPGSPLNPVSAGTNKLIKEGAKAITSFQDILDALDIPSITPSQVKIAEEKVEKLKGAAKILFDKLSNEPVHIDDLARTCKMDISYALSTLFSLEIEGLVKQLPGKRFIRNI